MHIIKEEQEAELFTRLKASELEKLALIRSCCRLWLEWEWDALVLLRFKFTGRLCFCPPCRSIRLPHRVSQDVASPTDVTDTSSVWHFIASIKYELHRHVLRKQHSVLRVLYFLYYVKGKGKGKAVPLQAWSAPEGSRKLRFPDFLTTAQDGFKVVSLAHRPPLSPENTTGTHVC